MEAMNRNDGRLTAKIVELTMELVEQDSVSHRSNEKVSRIVADRLEAMKFGVEWHQFKDVRGQTKVSLVAKRGSGSGGVAYLAHTDVVPADDWSAPFCSAFEPAIHDDRLYGRGTCDMKGSLACALIAAEQIAESQQNLPIYFVVTADEEVGMQGAKQVNQESAWFEEMVQSRTVGIVGEPTKLGVYHAHKGACGITVRARGKSAHTSTNDGINANYQLIPALAQLLELRNESETNPAYQNSSFDPPTLSWNMTITNEPEAVNVTPSLAAVNIFLRTMPRVDHTPLLKAIEQLCTDHNLEFELRSNVDPWQVPPESDWIRHMCGMVNQTSSQTVCFATDAGILQRLDRLMICGPGDIQQAHRSDEWISLEQLGLGAAVYERAFRHWACS